MFAQLPETDGGEGLGRSPPLQRFHPQKVALAVWDRKPDRKSWDARKSHPISLPLLGKDCSLFKGILATMETSASLDAKKLSLSGNLNLSCCSSSLFLCICALLTTHPIPSSCHSSLPGEPSPLSWALPAYGGPRSSQV